MSTHAQRSSSGAGRWMTCPGSVPLEEGYPDESSEFAAEGTAAHELAAMALTDGNDAVAYLGRVIEADGMKFTVDDEMAGYVQDYLDYVLSIEGELFVEQRLSIEHITGEAGAHGTSDAVILAGDELIITDLKYGRGVKVDATGNKQLQIYALAALAEHELVYDFKRARLVIHQPRLSHVSEWTISIEALRAFGNEVTKASERCDAAVAYFQQYGEIHEKYLAPSDDACRFCKAKADCPALRSHVLATVSDDFVDITEPIAPQLEQIAEREVDNALLGNLLGAVDLVEGWCKAIRAKAEAELFAGREVPGYKLVEGRRGNRAWGDDSEAETALKAMRMKVEEMYDLKLISPTTAEKLHKAGKIGPRQWPKLQALITQPDGKPSVAPESDKRPALVMTAVEDEFHDETACDLV